MKKRPNLDASGNLVKKGCTVARGALRGKVQKVKTGQAVVYWPGGRFVEYCDLLTVVAVPV